MALPKKFPNMYAAFMNGDFVVRHSFRKGSAVPIDQALEKEYNKPAKSPSGIIGVTRRKEAVYKWNLIKHEKAKYRKFLYNTCLMNDDDEYSLHHQFSLSMTKANEKSVSLLMEYVLQRGNPFNTGKHKDIINIATGTRVDEDETNFLLSRISLGETARDEFYESCLKEKSLKLFDTIPKTKKKSKKATTLTTYDVNKETVKFLRNIDYARLRKFDLRCLMKSEVAPISFYLMKDGCIRKPNKADLATEPKSLLTKKIPTSLPLYCFPLTWLFVHRPSLQ